MTLDVFCDALLVPREGNCDALETKEDESLYHFWKSIVIGDISSMKIAKYNYIQHPRFFYFVAFFNYEITCEG
jgi:hypothetical protein